MYNLLLSVLVSQCSWDPLAAQVVGAGVSGELEHGSLGILTLGNNLLQESEVSDHEKNTTKARLCA